MNERFENKEKARIKEKAFPYIYDDEFNCCGCSACYSICQLSSSGAISMVYHSDGFLYPVVDLEKCCGCQKCVNVCHLRKKNDDEKTK